MEDTMKETGEKKSPKIQNFVQYCNEHGISDPLVDILAMGSPSGNARSNRSYELRRNQLLAQSTCYHDALDSYQAEIDAGTIIDPTGKYKPTPPPQPKTVNLSNPPNIVIALRSQVAARPKSRKLKQALEQAESEWLNS